jgi:trimethylamine:corrinoid methyltransferase-like protein
MAREGGRRRRKTRPETGLEQLAWRDIDNPYRPVEALNEEQLEAISETAFQILEEVGMDFLHPDALEILRQGGAQVESGSAIPATGHAHSDWLTHIGTFIFLRHRDQSLNSTCLE